MKKWKINNNVIILWFYEFYDILKNNNKNKFTDII